MTIRPERIPAANAPDATVDAEELREFATLATPVHLAGLAGVIRTVTMGDLLPYSFGPEYLGKEAVR